jgi:hypothetical protein
VHSWHVLEEGGRALRSNAKAGEVSRRQKLERSGNPDWSGTENRSQNLKSIAKNRKSQITNQKSLVNFDFRFK